MQQQNFFTIYESTKNLLLSEKVCFQISIIIDTKYAHLFENKVQELEPEHIYKGTRGFAWMCV